jgi:hypothetical protein
MIYINVLDIIPKVMGDDLYFAPKHGYILLTLVICGEYN